MEGGGKERKRAGREAESTRECETFSGSLEKDGSVLKNFLFAL